MLGARALVSLFTQGAQQLLMEVRELQHGTALDSGGHSGRNKEVASTFNSLSQHFSTSTEPDLMLMRMDSKSQLQRGAAA